MEKNKKGTATNRAGLGSTYAGTQSPDNEAPDAYQQPTKKEEKKADSKQQAKNKDLGKEYESKSSYGEKGAKKKGQAGGEHDIVGGTPVR